MNAAGGRKKKQPNTKLILHCGEKEVNLKHHKMQKAVQTAGFNSSKSQLRMPRAQFKSCCVLTRAKEGMRC